MSTLSGGDKDANDNADDDAVGADGQPKLKKRKKSYKVLYNWGHLGRIYGLLPSQYTKKYAKFQKW